MADAAIDQEARDLAREAIADIRQHAAVCAEAEKRRDVVVVEIKGILEKIQKSYETGMIDMRAQIATGIDGVKRDAEKSVEDQGKINRDLYQRFWGLAIGTISMLVTAVAGLLTLIAHLIHWL